MKPGVYVMRTAGGDVLYVGFTKDRTTRMKNHERWKPWWADVAYIEWWPCESEAGALRLEGALITELGPRHNKTRLHGLPIPDVQLPTDLADELAAISDRYDLAGRVTALHKDGWSDAALGYALGKTAMWSSGMRAMLRRIERRLSTG